MTSPTPVPSSPPPGGSHVPPPPVQTTASVPAPGGQAPASSPLGQPHQPVTGVATGAAAVGADTASVSIATAPRILGALAQLAALGSIGMAVTAVVVGVAIAGAATAILGVGLLILAGVVYVLFGIAWVDRERIEGLYGLGIAPLRTVSQQRPGFSGALRALGRQAIDAGMWRALANFFIGVVLGGFVIFAMTLLAAGLATAFSPLYAGDGGGLIRIVGIGIAPIPAAAIPAGIFIMVVALAGLIGLALAHGAIARALYNPTARGALIEAARVSDVRRAGAVRAADVERSRIERDLHDGLQPRLVSLGMTLGLAQQQLDTDPDQARALIAEAHTSTKSAITELRQLARGVHASILDDRGLDAALSTLVDRAHVPVELDIRMDRPCSRDAEAAVYFAVAEGLTNAAKHARAGRCRVLVRQRPDAQGRTELWARVEDDGVGGARIVPGGGLDGIAQRILAAGGQFRFESPVQGPTVIEVTVPCAS